MTSPTHALAALRDGNPRDPRPFKVTLDRGLHLGAPAAAHLAEVFLLPLIQQDREIFRRRGGLLLTRPVGSTAEPTPTTREALVEELRSALLALPELTSAEAGLPYQHLRLLITEAEPGTTAAYLRSAVAALPKHVSYWAPPKARQERGPAKTPAELKKALRERQRDAAKAAAKAWLLHYLKNDAEPGERIAAGDLYEIADSDKFETPETEGTAPVVGPRQFYGVADEILGKRRYSHGVRYYAIPSTPNQEETMDPVTEAIVERTAEILADRTEQRLSLLRSGDRLGALLLQKEDLAATGTGGAVVDLSAARARRRS